MLRCLRQIHSTIHLSSSVYQEPEQSMRIIRRRSQYVHHPLGCARIRQPNHFRQHAGNIVRSSCLINPSNFSRVSVQTPGYIYLSSIYSWPLPPKWTHQTLPSRPLSLPLRPSRVSDIVLSPVSIVFRGSSLALPAPLRPRIVCSLRRHRRLHYPLSVSASYH